MSTSAKNTEDLLALSQKVVESLFDENDRLVDALCDEGIGKSKALHDKVWETVFRIRKERAHMEVKGESLGVGVSLLAASNCKEMSPESRIELLLAVADAYTGHTDPVSWHVGLCYANEATVLATRAFHRWLAWHRKGLLCDLLREFVCAVNAYLEALRVEEMGENPVVSATYSNLGVTYFHIGEFKEAEKMFEEARGRGQEKGVEHLSLNNLGFLNYVLHRYDKVEPYLKDALTRVPKNPCALYNRGLLRLQQWRQDPSDENRLREAAADFRRSYEGYAKGVEAGPRYALSAYYMEKVAYALLNPDSEDIRPPSDLDRELAGASRELVAELLDDIDNFIGATEEELAYLEDYLAQPRTLSRRPDELVVLRRWNSYTPIVPKPPRGRGGGYFLSWKGKGIVIDPGVDYLRNFYEAGYSLDDIDAVIVTHAHIDHCSDLHPLITMLYEKNERVRERRGQPRGIHLLLNIGTSIKDLAWTARMKSVVLTISTLNPLTSLSLEGYGIALTLDVVPARHDEVVSDRDAVGVVFNLKDGAKLVRLGYTSDTGWSEGLAECFKGCSVMVAHLGTVTFRELAMLARFGWTGDIEKDLLDEGRHHVDLKKLGFQDKRTALEYLHRSKEYSFRDAMESQHLGFAGLYLLARDVHPTLMVISEFGEELGTFRHRIARALAKSFEDLKRCGKVPSVPRFLTGDIGLRVRLSDLHVRCDICGDYTAKKIRAKCRRNREKALFYYCEDHTLEEITAKFEYA